MTPFTAIIPARLASTRLPRKPLLEIAGKPMVVRVAERAAAAGARQVVVATDSEEIAKACHQHQVECLLTSEQHATGTDRLAEACLLLRLSADEIVVNVQGDEPLIPPTVVSEVAALLATRSDCQMATAAHPLHDIQEFFNPNVVKVVTDQTGRALLFTRAPIPWARDAFQTSNPAAALTIPAALPNGHPAWRHVGLYAYRASFLQQFPQLPRAPIEVIESLEQLRALWHGMGIAVLALAAPLPPGVDTAEDLTQVRALFS